MNTCLWLRPRISTQSRKAWSDNYALNAWRQWNTSKPRSSLLRHQAHFTTYAARRLFIFIPSCRRDKEFRKQSRYWDQQQSKPDAKFISADGVDLEKRLASPEVDPAVILKEGIAAGNANVEFVRICFQAYYDRLAKRTRPQRPHVIWEDKIEAATLLWLWSQNMRWAAAVLEDVFFLENLCYTLVAEGLDDYVIGWMEEHLPPHTLAELGPGGSHQWRGALLRTLVKAHSLLDSSRCADPMLDVFFRIADKVLPYRNSSDQKVRTGSCASIFLWPATVQSAKDLATGRFTHTNPQKWTRFERTIEATQKDMQGKMMFAQVSLWRPRRPDPGPAIEFLRRQREGQSVDETVENLRDRQSARESLMFFARTSRVLREQQRTTDAQWVHECLLQLFNTQDLRQFACRANKEFMVRHQIDIPEPHAVKSGTSTTS